MKRFKWLVCLLFVTGVQTNIFAAGGIIVSSPDANVQLKLDVVQNQLNYSINFRNKPVIENSPVILSVDQTVITSGITIGKIEKYAADETYSWYGVHSKAINHFNGAKIAVRQNKNGLSYTFEVRVFNDGAAFRILVPGSAHLQRIPDEATIFKIPAGSTIWYHDLVMHYEGVHVKKDISEVKNNEWLAPPATIKLPQGGYAAITEADLENYSGMALQADGNRSLVLRLAHNQPTSYPYKLRYSPEDTLRLKKPASVSGTIITPWRVVMVGADLNAMVNSDIIHDLCPPPDKKLFPAEIYTSWIKPGRAVWKYLDGGGEGTPEVMKKFADEASQLGFEHNIMEGFWSRWTDDQIRDVVNYSKERGVGIWVWKHSKSLRDPQVRQEFFKRCHDLGITGVKIDFFDSEAKEVIDLYQSILRETAQQKLLVDFHGSDKPTGLSRTWPNELTREAVKGMESSKLADRATHETTLPFTRFLAGPAEYTVVHFGDRRKNTTWAHQIASAAILSAPLLTYAANPENILNNPAVDMIKSIPSTWDETIVLPGSEIGELAAFARRKGNTWFLAVMNGVKPKELQISLSFLGKGDYKAMLVKDNPANTAAVEIENASFKPEDHIQLQLGEGGGYIARFTAQ